MATEKQHETKVDKADKKAAEEQKREFGPADPVEAQRVSQENQKPVGAPDPTGPSPSFAVAERTQKENEERQKEDAKRAKAAEKAREKEEDEK